MLAILIAGLVGDVRRRRRAVQCRDAPARARPPANARRGCPQRRHRLAACGSSGAASPEPAVTVGDVGALPGTLVAPETSVAHGTTTDSPSPTEEPRVRAPDSKCQGAAEQVTAVRQRVGGNACSSSATRSWPRSRRAAGASCATAWCREGVGGRGRRRGRAVHRVRGRHARSAARPPDGTPPS